jgi:hypothetical protein
VVRATVSKIVVDRSRLLRRAVLTLFLSICALLLLAWIFVQIEQHSFRHRAELLLNNIQLIELRKTSWREAQTRLQNWKSNSSHGRAIIVHGSRRSTRILCGLTELPSALARVHCANRAFEQRCNQMVQLHVQSIRMKVGKPFTVSADWEGNNMTQAAQHRTATAILRNSLGLVFAAALALAPQPAFAQHGGGGGGGGSHGGGGGGSHSSGGGSHASSGGGHASSGSHASTGSTGGHVNSGTNPGHTASNSSNAGPTGAHVWYGPSSSGGNSGAAPQHFAANNNTWQDPPAPRAPTTQHFHNVPNGVSTSSASGSAVGRTHGTGVGVGVGVRAPSATSQVGVGVHSNTVSAPHIFRPGRGSGGRIYYPYYPFYPYGAFGFGFWGNGFGCDPFWGWGCYGFGSGLGYGFGGSYGAGYSDSYGYNGNVGAGLSIGGGDYGPGAQGDMSSGSQPQGAGDWQNAPDDQTQSSAAVAAAQQYPVLVLRDGSMYAVNDFWLEGGKLHYVTTYGGENSFDPNQLDMQRTVDENAKRGITFTLYPSPAPASPAKPLQPPPANDQQPPPQDDNQ